MAGSITQLCNMALHGPVLGLLTLFIISTWTTSVSASEPNEIRAWSQLHSIPETELQQHRDWSSVSPSVARDGSNSGSTSIDSSNDETIWKPVSPGSGIGDNVATVGRVFKFAIPEGAFRGDISHYKVSLLSLLF